MKRKVKILLILLVLCSHDNVLQAMGRCGRILRQVVVRVSGQLTNAATDLARKHEGLVKDGDDEYKQEERQPLPFEHFAEEDQQVLRELMMALVKQEAEKQ